MSKSGWLYRLIQEGWLRTRWRKRWCVLGNQVLTMFEYETSDANDIDCGKIDLSNYSACSRATKRDCKKSQFTLVLEIPKNSKKKVKRELLYAESDSEIEEWIKNLNYSITIATTGSGPALAHVTKTRVQGAKRRPPTRQHLRERATTSDLETTVEVEEKKKPMKRGHVPEKALKPPVKKLQANVASPVLPDEKDSVNATPPAPEGKSDHVIKPPPVPPAKPDNVILPPPVPPAKSDHVKLPPPLPPVKPDHVKLPPPLPPNKPKTVANDTDDENDDVEDSSHNDTNAEDDVMEDENVTSVNDNVENENVTLDGIDVTDEGNSTIDGNDVIGSENVFSDKDDIIDKVDDIIVCSEDSAINIDNGNVTDGGQDLICGNNDVTGERDDVSTEVENDVTDEHGDVSNKVENNVIQKSDDVSTKVENDVTEECDDVSTKEQNDVANNEIAAGVQNGAIQHKPPGETGEANDDIALEKLSLSKFETKSRSLVKLTNSDVDNETSVQRASSLKQP